MPFSNHIRGCTCCLIDQDDVRLEDYNVDEMVKLFLAEMSDQVYTFFLDYIITAEMTIRNVSLV